MVTEAYCGRCKLTKPASEFSKDSGNKATGLQRRCKQCQKEQFKIYYDENRDHLIDKVMAYREKYGRTDMHARYGITNLEYKQMVDERQGRCQICDKKPITLTVDHDHDTGKFRGLLCDGCNNGLGKFKDDPRLLMKAIKYLEEYMLAVMVGEV